MTNKNQSSTGTSPLSIVQNRTPSLIHEQTKAKEHAEAEKRRVELDKKRALAKQKPAEARLYNHSLGGVGSHAAVVLKVPWKDGSTKTWITCELSVDEDGLTLVIVCPACVFRYNRRMEDSQITMRSWHRRFSLEEFGKGELWVNPVNPAETVLLAGAIATHEPQTCPVCHYKFQIERSRDPNERGVSVIREI